MRALQTKLWRDVRRLRAQAVTIALVVAIGVGGFVGLFSVHASLLQARDSFYRDNRLADVFVDARRAPAALAARLAATDGVAEVATGVAMEAQIDLGDPGAPVTGRFIGLDLARAHAGRQGLDALTLRAGRWPEAGSALEAVVSEGFARERALVLGDRVRAVLNGRLQTVHVVGLVVSPAYVFASRAGAPDPGGFGVWWVDDDRLEQLLDMRGAFNHASLRLQPGQAAGPVVDAVDRLLTPYGSLGAQPQADLISARIVNDELSQLEVMGTVLPAIFLLVAVFILNGVLSRQVATQRAQIAALKALGYTDAAIAWHYLQLAALVAALGVLAGLLLSGAIGAGMLSLYQDAFRFPALVYRTAATPVAVALPVVLAAAALGAWSAVAAVVRLRPAQAMQPPTPAPVGRGWFERLGLTRRLRAAGLMVVRDVQRRPWRTAFTVSGLALAMGLQISGAFWFDALRFITDVEFRQAQRGEVLVGFHPPVDADVARDLRRLPGVLQAQALRSEAVEVRLGARTKDATLTGLPADAPLMRLVDVVRGPLTPPAEGVVLSALLARALQARVGDTVEVRFRQGARRTVRLPVTDVAHSLMGQQAWMRLDTLDRVARDGAVVSAAALHVDPTALPALWAAIKRAPAVVSVFDKRAAQKNFDEMTARNMGTFSAVLTLFAVAMAVGIAYNAARIALSERAWELASLRVLGMTRAEVSVLLLAQLGIELLLALPLGVLAGWGLASLLMALMASDNIDFPVII